LTRALPTSWVPPGSEKRRRSVVPPSELWPKSMRAGSPYDTCIVLHPGNLPLWDRAERVRDIHDDLALK